MLQGTRWSLIDTARRYDVIGRCWFIVISLGVYEHDRVNLPAGSAIVLDAAKSGLPNVKRVWVPRDVRDRGRVGMIGLKRMLST